MTRRGAAMAASKPGAAQYFMPTIVVTTILGAGQSAARAPVTAAQNPRMTREGPMIRGMLTRLQAGEVARLTEGRGKERRASRPAGLAALGRPRRVGAGRACG